MVSGRKCCAAVKESQGQRESRPSRGMSFCFGGRLFVRGHLGATGAFSAKPGLCELAIVGAFGLGSLTFMSDDLPSICANQLLADLPSVPAKLRQAMDECGWRTVADALNHLPRRYEDRRQFERFPADPSEAAVTLHVIVDDVRTLRFGSKRRIFEATLIPGESGGMPGQQITARWFNLPFMSKVIAVDQQLIVHGKVKLSGKRLVIDHPESEVIVSGGELDADPVSRSVHLRRIVPVYPLKNGLQQRPLREFLFEIITRSDPENTTFPERIPADAWTKVAENLVERKPAAELFRLAHFPPDMEAMDAARRVLALGELFLHQVHVVDRKRHHRALDGKRHAGRGALLKTFADTLPFALTGAQMRAIREIRNDLKSNQPMNRLLQGDVGSGKTAVAMAAAMLVVEDGWQVVVMAPTQILAEQHFLNFRKVMEPLGIRLALRTGAGIQNNHDAEQDAQIVIGTHALLFDNDELLRRDSLGLVIVDEQHKFGVAQRARLKEAGETTSVPDVLVMTATPIPRTLQMTVYGDLDVSIIDELPAGRGKIITGIRVAPKVSELKAFLKEQLALGRQAYFVYPLVEESESSDAKAATTAHAEWAKRLSKYAVALLTGRMSGEEKDAVMTRFRSGEVDLLVSTTVIEVGVDVPNTSVMVVHDANRFGLAQLHQLRGRIGRGEHKSYCVLLLDKKHREAAERLAILVETRDGFRIAEEDLRQRGPGDALGTAQSGLPDLPASTRAYLGDTRLLVAARGMAEALLGSDPDLSNPMHAGIREELVHHGDPLGSRFAHIG